MTKAADIFRMWHAKEPRKEYRRSSKLLDDKIFVPIGEAIEIEYRSDKWERDGDFHVYYHEHTSKPRVYLPESVVREGEEKGRSIRNTSALGIRATTKQLEVAQLGTVNHLIFVDAGGEQATFSLGKRTLLLSCPDLKGIILLTPSVPIVVRGGSMRVTERGIVK